MSDTVAEVKETVASPEKEVVAKKVEKEVAAEKVEEKKETNGEAKKNGVSKESKDEEESTDDKPAENGDSKETEDDEEEASSKAKKRTSDVVDGEESADKDVSPAKKSKVEEKSENGSAETETAA